MNTKGTQTGAKLKILLVDDHRLYRDGIEALLSGVKDLEIVGSVSTGEEALSQYPALKPDVILMDIMMPGMTGIEATRWIKEQCESIKIILVSSQVNKEWVSAGIQAGIDGYLPKDVEKSTLLEAIRTVMAGGRFFTQAITSLVFEDFYNHKKNTFAKGKCDNHKTLTKREMQVLILVASGKGNKEIADGLFISVKTVETHKANILAKLGLKNTAEVVRYAIKYKLINVDE